MIGQATQALLRQKFDYPGAIIAFAHPSSGRNRIHRVQLGHGGRVLHVKEPGDATVPGASHEALCLGELDGRYPFMPRVAFWSLDPPASGCDFLESATSLQSMAQAQPAAVVSHLAALAAPLASLHLLEIELPDAPQAQPQLDPIWIHEWIQCSPAARAFIRKLQSAPELTDALRRTVHQSDQAGVIHGDLKLDNILVQGTRPVLVDFELAGRGPVLRDVASVLGSIIAVWIEQLAVKPGVPVQSWISHASIDFGVVQSAVTDFLENYYACLGRPRADSSELAQCVAAWLVGRAYGDCVFRIVPTPSTWIKLRIARNLIRDGLGSLIR